MTNDTTELHWGAQIASAAATTLLAAIDDAFDSLANGLKPPR
jgi:hypothetical protein